MNNMVFSIIFTMSLVITGITYGVDVKEVIQGPTEFISKDGDYTIKIPDKWELMKDQMGTDFIALAPALDTKDLFRENLNVITAKFDFPITREEYYSLNIKSLNDLLTDFDLEESHDVQLGGIEARMLIFTHRIGVVNVKVIQYLLLIKQKAIVVSFTSDTIEYPKFKEQFDKIASTLNFEKK